MTVDQTTERSAFFTVLSSGLLAALTIAACGWLAAGCNQSGGTRGSGAATPGILPAAQRSIEAKPGQVRTLQESDIYALSSSTLFVQNPARGLAVIDVTDPDAPRLTQQLTTLTGSGGELYLEDPNLLAVFEESSLAPGSAEVAAITSTSAGLQVTSRIYVSGTLVASRRVGELLYVVTLDGLATRVAAIDVRDLSNLSLVDQELFPGEGHEVHVTDQAIYVAQNRATAGLLGTRLTYVDISDPSGQLRLRGEIDLAGAPQGRFHMDESGTTFRIVTFTGRQLGTNLYVIDVTNPDQLAIRGELLGLAPDEDLRATRFVGDRAYVVTFEPATVTVRGIGFFIIDPLWVIDLSDPANPTVLGELKVPGWSDYVFPRGDRLVAVGRGGEIGETVAVSLFDVADPRNPQELRRLEFGVPSSATSEANSDFRGVTIVEKGTLGAEAMLVVPYTDNLDDPQGNCSPEHFVQLFDLRDDDLVIRGRSRQVGLVRRTLPLGTKLYAITDKTVAVLDVDDRDQPRTTTSLETGDIAAVETCSEVFVPRPNLRFSAGCTLSAGEAATEVLPVCWLLALVGLLALRRRGEGPRAS